MHHFTSRGASFLYPSNCPYLTPPDIFLLWLKGKHFLLSHSDKLCSTYKKIWGIMRHYKSYSTQLLHVCTNSSDCAMSLPLLKTILKNVLTLLELLKIIFLEFSHIALNVFKWLKMRSFWWEF
jgi:hypothetical protein